METCHAVYCLTTDSNRQRDSLLTFTFFLRAVIYDRGDVPTVVLLSASNNSATSDDVRRRPRRDGDLLATSGRDLTSVADKFLVHVIISIHHHQQQKHQQ